MQPFELVSHGARLKAFFAPPTDRPTLVFCHGFPGRNFNLAIAKALHARGYGALAFRYRGAHGSQGEYSFRGNEQDIRVALEAARAHAPHGLGLLGYSMGGFHATRVMAEEPGLADFLVLQAPAANLEEIRGGWERMQPGAFLAFLREAEGVLKVDVDDLLEEWKTLRPDEEASEMAPRIEVPALVMHGTRDPVVPFEQGKLLAKHLGGPTELVAFDTDHGFEGVEEQAADAIDAFVRAKLPGKR